MREPRSARLCSDCRDAAGAHIAGRHPCVVYLFQRAFCFYCIKARCTCSGTPKPSDSILGSQAKIILTDRKECKQTCYYHFLSKNKEQGGAWVLGKMMGCTLVEHNVGSGRNTCCTLKKKKPMMAPHLDGYYFKRNKN